MQQADGVRRYGAGIAASFTEGVFALASASPNRIGFDPARVMRTPCRIDDFQGTYFALRSLGELLALAHVDFGPLYEGLGDGTEHQPGDVLSTDLVIARVNGAHHAAKRPTLSR